jgi:hypothetical protein
MSLLTVRSRKIKLAARLWQIKHKGFLIVVICKNNINYFYLSKGARVKMTSYFVYLSSNLFPKSLNQLGLDLIVTQF